VAPNFINCESLFDKYNKRLPIQKQTTFVAKNNYLPFENVLFNGNYLINGWSEPEDWGVWSNHEKSRLIIQAENTKGVEKLVISGHRFKFADGSYPEMKINLNGKERFYQSQSRIDSDQIVIDLTKQEVDANNFFIEFIFYNLSTPREQFGIADDRPLGYALKSIKFN
jgi:hypothetical protein